MKIAIVIEKFQPLAGGNERSTEQMARQLIARGHEVTIIANRVADAPEGAQVLCAGGPSTATALGLNGFARWARRQLNNGFDASLSVTTAVPATICQPRGGTVRETLARHLASSPGTWSRVRRQIGLGLRIKPWMLLAMEKRTFNDPMVRKFVAISRYVQDQLIHHYTVPPRRIEIIPNAAEITCPSPAQRDGWRQKVRAALDLRLDDVVYLFAAHNPSLKGLETLLEAQAKLMGGVSRARLVVAGVLHSGPQRLARRLGLAGVVRFIGPTRHMDELYAAADVTVLPTWYDPSSKVVLESLMHGVPAISTLYNGASSWIADPSGVLVLPSVFGEVTEPLPHADWPAGRVIANPGDAQALAHAMAELADPIFRRRCAQAASGLKEILGMDRHVDRLEDLLRRTAASDVGVK